MSDKTPIEMLAHAETEMLERTIENGRRWIALHEQFVSMARETWGERTWVIEQMADIDAAAVAFDAFPPKAWWKKDG
jgi:hypothetical protein